MRNCRENNCEEIIDLLTRKYWSQYKNELDQQIANITQDFISRGLSNSTIRISKQLHTEFEYVQKLIVYVVEMLKQDFSHIPLTTCKGKLLKVIEVEYGKLMPKTTSRLVQANLSQKGILEQYKNGIIGEIEKTKAKVEILCTLSEKENLAVLEKEYNSKPSQSMALKADRITLIAAVLTLIGAVLTSPLWIPIINEMFGDSGERPKVITQSEISEDTSAKSISNDPNNQMPIDQETPESKKLQMEPIPIISKGEGMFKPEETEGDVNRPELSPILKIRETSIAPEEKNGELNERKKSDLIKRKERPIEPES